MSSGFIDNNDEFYDLSWINMGIQLNYFCKYDYNLYKNVYNSLNLIFLGLKKLMLM